MRKVLLIDSGSGGVNILKECLKVYPCCDFLMFCDNKNLPYGSKTKEDLIQITTQNLEFVRDFFPFEFIVFACNTLTSTCIDFCREKFSDVEFVGTVPAIKPALEKFLEKEILVIATEATIKHNKLISKHPNINCLEMPDLASLIDENLDNLDCLTPYLEDELLSYINGKKGEEKIKALVLGCTHYVALKPILEKILPEMEIFDGANGVARRIGTLVGGESGDYQVRIMTSENGDMWAKLWNYLNS